MLPLTGWNCPQQFCFLSNFASIQGTFWNNFFLILKYIKLNAYPAYTTFISASICPSSNRGLLYQIYKYSYFTLKYLLIKWIYIIFSTNKDTLMGPSCLSEQTNTVCFKSIFSKSTAKFWELIILRLFNLPAWEYCYSKKA